MATRDRIERGGGYLPEPQPIRASEGKLTPQAVDTINGMFAAIVHVLNGNLTEGDGTAGSGTGNLYGQWIDVVTPSVADTEFVVPHGLKRLAVGVLVVAKDKAAIVYDSNRGSWTRDKILLKCDTGSVTLKLRIL